MIRVRVAHPSGRADGGDRTALYTLKRWPDPRALPYFERHLAGDPRLLELDSALEFFVYCMKDQGQAYLTQRLGDPAKDFVTFPFPHSDSLRLRLLDVLWSAVNLHDLRILPSWRGYVASVLAADHVDEQHLEAASGGMKLLIAGQDPRAPCVIDRLIRQGGWNGSDVVPALTTTDSTESRTLRKSLKEWCAIKLATAKGNKRLDFEELTDYLS